MSLAVSLNRRKDSEAGWLFRPSDFQRSSRSILRTRGIDHSLVGAGGVVFPPPTATWNDLNEPKNSYPRSNPHHLHDGGFNVRHDVAIDHGAYAGMAFGLALASTHRLAYCICLHPIHDAIGIRSRQSDHRKIIRIWREPIYAVGITRCMTAPCKPYPRMREIPACTFSSAGR